MESTITENRSFLKEDNALLRKDIAKFKTDIIKWIVATGIVITVLVVALIKLL
jgi:hypothetical protein